MTTIASIRTALTLTLSVLALTGCSSEQGQGFHDTSPDASSQLPTCSCPSSIGCCVGSTCVQPHQMDWTACGLGGETCQACETGALCTNLGLCDNSSWGPDTLLRLRLGVVKVDAACDPVGACDPYVCFHIRGNDICTSACQDSNACDYGQGSDPFIIEKFRPSDFTSGELTVTVYDDDVSVPDTIWSRVVKYPSPLVRKQTPYVLGPSGNLVYLSFTLEAM